MKRTLVLVPLFALFITVAGGGSLWAEEKSADAAPEAKDVQKDVKQVRLASIALQGGLPEAPSQAGLFGQLQQNLRQMIERLEQAAQDDEISGVLLDLDGAGLGRARVGELRAAIARTQAAGKKVYARLDAGEAADYLLATACDEIVMAPSGSLVLPGVRMEVTFYKGLLDKMGIEADFLHVGAYKGAAEPLTRESFSPEVKENLTSIVDDYYEQMVQTIARDRKLKPARVRKLIDQGLFTAEQAKAAGLIDRIAYRDQLEEQLRKRLKADQLKLVKGYGKKKVDEDFSGPMGAIKLMQALMGGSTTQAKSKGKKIAVVYAVGAITTGKSAVGMFGGETLGSDTLIAALRKAEEDEQVAAIVLRIDSPGGSALASDLIWREIVRIEKPIIASMGDTAASGGYYIAMGTDKIFAGEGTLTGSIGVVGGKLALGGLLEKAGVHSEVISRGKNSGLFSPEHRFSKTERQALQAMMEDTYRQFTTKAAKGREMAACELEKLAGGQVWTGRQAKKNGLVDEIGTLEDALAAAKEAAGLAADEKVEILELPKATSFLESLLSGDTEEATLRVQVDAALPSLLPQLRRVERLQAIFRERQALVLPYELEVK